VDFFLDLKGRWTFQLFPRAQYHVDRLNHPVLGWFLEDVAFSGPCEAEGRRFGKNEELGRI